MPTRSEQPGKKKSSTLKKVGIYVLVWVAVCVLFVSYVSIAPNNGGFTQGSVDFVGQLLGVGFFIGLLIVLGFNFSAHFFPPTKTAKDLLNEDLKKKSR
jgi:hypothetical protein